jgi:hypothetical protein
MGSRGRGPGEAHDFRDYKRLAAFAKLATSYKVIDRTRAYLVVTSFLDY